MSTSRGMWGWIARISGLLILGASMNADAGLFGIGGTSWKEEVLLHDGSKIIVDRWHKRGGRHEITSGPPVKEQSITFTMPGTSQTITWRDEYSNEVGSANFEPLALHIHDRIPYLIATPYGCLAYNKWGRPNPPYVIFKHSSDSWQRISLLDLPSMFKAVNLVIDTSNNEKKLDKLGQVSVTNVERMNRDYRQPELRTILREPVKLGTEGSLVNCPDYNSPRYTSPKAPNPTSPAGK